MSDDAHPERPVEALKDAPKQLGRYQIVRVIGRGAMGLVYEGYDPNVGRRVAIKTILVQALAPELATEFENRFRTEARSAGRLQHPNIVSVYDADRDIDVAYLVMEYVKGRDLKQLIDEGATFALSDVRSIMRQLLAALDSAHQQNIIHRDVKPANMLMQEDGGLKLTDFGVARIADSGEATRTGGGLVGTLKYMSPEQVKGLAIDSRADLFSAGVVLYQLLTGRQPFRGDNDFALIRQIANDDPPAPSTLNTGLNAEIDAVVAKALAKEPTDRFANAREFASELRRVLQRAEGVTPTPDPDADDGPTPETFSDTRTPASPQFISRLQAAASAGDKQPGSRGEDSVSSLTAFNSLNDEATLVVQPPTAGPSVVDGAGDARPANDQTAALAKPPSNLRWLVLGGAAVIVAGLGWALLGGRSSPPAMADGSAASSAAGAANPAGVAASAVAASASAVSGAVGAASKPTGNAVTKSVSAQTTTASVSKRTVSTAVSATKPSSAPTSGSVAAPMPAPEHNSPAQSGAAAPAAPAPKANTATTSPSAACADRSWLTRSNCVFQQCERVAEFRNHPECVTMREEVRQREERERNR